MAPGFLGLGGLTTILYQQGVSLEQLGAFQALTILGLAKFLWAPLVDRYGARRFGHYRSWLLVTQVAVAALIPLDPVGDLGSVTVLVLVLWVLMGTQDVATDALFIRLLDESGRGVANGIQTAAGFLGTILRSGAVLLVYDRIGWTAALLILAVATALPMLRFREPAPVRPERNGFATLADLLRQPGVARWALVLLPMLWAGIGGYFTLLNPMLLDAGWSLSQIGVVVTVFGSLVAIAGGLAAGPITARLGQRRSLLVFGIAQLVVVPGLFAVAYGHAEPLFTTIVICLVHLIYAATTAASTVSMDLGRPDSAGSDYTALSTVGTAVSFGVGAASTALAGTFGYPLLLAAAVGLLAAGVLATLLFFPKSGPSLRSSLDTSSPAAAGRPPWLGRSPAELLRDFPQALGLALAAKPGIQGLLGRRAGQVPETAGAVEPPAARIRGSGGHQGGEQRSLDRPEQDAATGERPRRGCPVPGRVPGARSAGRSGPRRGARGCW
ncbi:MFS transporter [Amycolatopsis sulphurea]|uniref:MFS transporter n=1 Tax=Amycolatopsis sulphurea TaxID=76022 RepID=A0A2A9FG44_9PSEU|nr:MFS transporter [Amycolatopsis sulphurea]PFG49893.1 MFS transporter [Amycolatopsis sulphurea]